MVEVFFLICYGFSLDIFYNAVTSPFPSLLPSFLLPFLLWVSFFLGIFGTMVHEDGGSRSEEQGSDGCGYSGDRRQPSGR